MEITIGEVILAITTLVTVIGGYFTTRAENKQTKEKVDAVDKKIEANFGGDADAEKRITKLEGKVEYMESDIKSIKDDLKKMTDNQLELQKSMIEINASIDSLAKEVRGMVNEFKEYRVETQKNIDKFYYENEGKVKKPI